MAIEKCIPALGIEPDQVQYVVREDVLHMAMSAETDEERAWIERRQKIIAAKAVEDQAKLKAEEPALIAAWRTCLVTNTRQLAQLTQEPAEAIAMAAFAACRSQRQNLIQLHQRYGDAYFDATVIDDVERRITSNLMLEVMQTRATRTVPELPPKQPVTPPSRDDQAI